MISFGRIALSIVFNAYMLILFFSSFSVLGLFIYASIFFILYAFLEDKMGLPKLSSDFISEVLKVLFETAYTELNNTLNLIQYSISLKNIKGSLKVPSIFNSLTQTR